MLAGLIAKKRAALYARYSSLSTFLERSYRASVARMKKALLRKTAESLRLVTKLIIA